MELVGRVEPAEEPHQLADVMAGVVPARRTPRPDRPGTPVGDHRRAEVTVERVKRDILVFPLEPLDACEAEPPI